MRHLSPRGHLDGIVVNPFASSCLVDGTQVYSLVGFDPSTSFMFIAPCADPRIRFYGYIELKHVIVQTAIPETAMYRYKLPLLFHLEVL